MNLNQKICDFNNCFVDYVNKWASALNHGENTDEQETHILLMNSIIETLECYDFHPKRKVRTRSVIVPECDILNFNTNSLILYKTTCIDLDPDKVNCLTAEELCPLIEKMSIICENCNCNC